MFHIRAPKCPNCRAPLKAPKEAYEIDCCYCGAHVQIRKPKKRKPAAAPQKRHSPPPPLSPKYGGALVVSGLLFIGSSAMAFTILANTDAPELASYEPEEQPRATTMTMTTTTTTKVVQLPDVSFTISLGNTDDKHKKHHKKKKKSKSKKKHEESDSAPDKAGRELRSLSKSQAKKTLRSVRMLHCSESGKAKVRVTIDRSGSVRGISTSETGSTSIGLCVAQTIRALRFPASSDGLTISYRYKW